MSFKLRFPERSFLSSSIAALVVVLAGACDRTPDADLNVPAVIGGLGLAPGKFSYPRAIAAEARGSVFVIDKTGRIQRFSAEGALETRWVMPETAQGKPVGMKMHPDGRLFVADTHYHRVMVFDRDGKELATFGKEGFGEGEFQLPTNVAFDRQGFIYVGEYMENDRITKWSPDLRFVKVVSDQPIEGKRFGRPAGLDVDAEQTLWVADACNHRIVRLSLDGDVLAVFGEMGSAPGQLRYPYDICVTPEDTLVVCEHEGNRLQWFSKDGRSLRTWGHGGRKPGELFAPWGMACGQRGRVYVVDSLNNRVQIVEP